MKVTKQTSMRYLYTRLTYQGIKEANTKKFVALYGIFRECPDGRIEGQTEHSFNMDWSGIEVAVIPLDGVKLPEPEQGYKYFAYRISRKSPNRMIIAHFKTRKEEEMVRHTKYGQRNVRFSVNPKFKRNNPID